MIKPQTLKGFRDFLPEQMAIRNKVKQILIEVFESYGFQPLETPAIEFQSTLLNKYGDEANKLVYTFNDKGNRPVGLRYDLTVPLAKVAALYQNQLTSPFKRYQIQPVWRADKPQKGRYREIEMCDIDILNSNSPLADAEIIAITNTALTKLGFQKFTIRVNSRQVLFSLIKKAGIDESLKLSVIQTIDKLDKKTIDQVKDELKKKKITDEQIKKIFQSLKQSSPDKYLQQVIDLSDSKNIKFDPTLSRGLDYYTSTIFETIIEKPQIGSITGGGRYDQLIKQLGGPDWPAVGTTFGLDRLCDIILENNLWSKIKPTKTQVLVTLFDQSTIKSSLQLAKELRQTGLNTEIYPDAETRLDKQFKYANKKQIPFVAILGPEEIKKKVITLKNMKTGQQTTDSLEKIAKMVV